MQLMGMLPFPLLERISLSASLHHNVSDATLPLLCHPHVRRLVLVGDFSDRGLSDALCPRLAAVGDGDVSWEVCAFSFADTSLLTGVLHRPERQHIG
jgi:hypothetical protein